MIEIKKLKDFIKEEGIKEGQEIDQIPFTDWYIFDRCFGYIFGFFDGQELNEDYIVLANNPKISFEDIKKKYHVENGEIKQND